MLGINPLLEAAKAAIYKEVSSDIWLSETTWPDLIPTSIPVQRPTKSISNATSYVVSSTPCYTDSKKLIELGSKLQLRLAQSSGGSAHDMRRS